MTNAVVVATTIVTTAIWFGGLALLQLDVSDQSGPGYVCMYACMASWPPSTRRSHRLYVLDVVLDVFKLWSDRHRSLWTEGPGRFLQRGLYDAEALVCVVEDSDYTERHVCGLFAPPSGSLLI